MEKLKKHAWSFTVFFINGLLLLLGYQTIKNSDKNNVAVVQDSQVEIKPLDQKTIDAQNKINTDRENKLRNLNNSPKQIKQNQVTTQTTTAVPTTTSKKSSSKTKTS